MPKIMMVMLVKLNQDDGAAYSRTLTVRDTAPCWNRACTSNLLV